MTTWNEVLAKPEYQKLSPEEKEAARNGYFTEVVAPKVPKEQLAAARQAFDQDTGQKKSIGTGAKTQPWQYTVGETLRQGLTSAGGAIAGGYRALGGALAGDPNSGEKGQALAQQMTYQAQSEVAKSAVQTAAIPGEKIAQGADVVGRDIAEVTGSPALGAASNTLTQAAGQILLGKGAGLVGEATGVTKALGGVPTPGGVTARVAARAPPPLALAKAYTTNRLGMKWDDLPKGVQKRLQTAARDRAELFKLDAATVEREARAERLEYPVTRGQATRNVEQLTREENIKKSGSENEIRKIEARQDERLHDLLDESRKSTGATAETRESVGKSVQDQALRGKEKASEENYDALYKKARETEPSAAVSAQPLYDLLDEKPHIQHLGFVQSWLNKAKVKSKGEGPGTKIDLDTNISKAKKKGVDETHAEMRNVPLHELDDLRKEASGVASKGGTEAYYAQQVVNAIDHSFEQIPPAAKAWTAARNAFKAHKIEFEDQKIVRDLVGDKTRTDRATALEDTTAKVLSRSSEDIAKLKNTLTTGGTANTREAGLQAWKNLQAGVIDMLREKAAGKRGIVGEKNQAEFNAAFRDLFSELDKDGKIDQIFDKKQAERLRDIYRAVGDVRTKPSARISGSPTAANLNVENTLSALEKISKMTGGKFVVGAVKAAKWFRDQGARTREEAHAKTTPLSEAADTARRNRANADKKRNRFGRAATKKKSPNTLKGLRTSAGAAGRLTLQDQNSDQR